MTQNKKISWGGVTSYESPLVKTLEIASEGLLCGSYTWTKGGAGTYDGFINDNNYNGEEY